MIIIMNKSWTKNSWFFSKRWI